MNRSLREEGPADLERAGQATEGLGDDRTTRILFVTPYAGGNVSPTLAIAGSLIADGQRVRMLGHPQLADGARQAEVPFVPFHHARRWSPLTPRPGLLSMLGWLRLASDPGIARDVAEELRRSEADVVVVDCMTPVALRAAHRSGAKVVLLMHAFSQYWADQWSPRSPIGIWLRLTRTHPERYPAHCAVVTTAPELDLVDAEQIPASEVYQAGAVVPQVEHPAPLLDGDPVLVSFSTISYPGQRGALQRTLDAIAELSMPALATIEPLLAEGLQIPSNVELRGLEPHARILPGVRLLIGHGGHGTTMAALAHGVPVLVIAMSSFADQPLVGEAVARAGAGLGLGRDAPVGLIREAVHSLTTDPQFAARASELGSTLRDRPASLSAAKRIVAVAQEEATGRYP